MTTTANNTSTGTVRRFFTRCLTTTGEQHEQVGSILAIAARQHGHLCVWYPAPSLAHVALHE